LRAIDALAGATAPMGLANAYILSYILNTFPMEAQFVPGSSTNPKGETFTFRLDSALKAGIAQSAKEQHVQPAELMRTLVREHLASKARRVFEAEARKQSLAIAARARDPDGDEAQVLREIEAGLDRDDFADTWNA
jgi:hypothetical protein